MRACVRECMRACVRVCAQCVGVVCGEVIQYYDYVTIIFEALMNKCFVDLVKRGVLTFVCDTALLGDSAKLVC